MTMHVPVLIVGGGGCGLAASIFLSELGIESLLVERHPTPGRMPKARYLNQRTMEVFRQFGVSDKIYAKSMPLKHMSRIRWCTTLGGNGSLDRRVFHQIDSFGGGSLTHYAKDSPCPSTLYPQVRLEPLLRDEADARAPDRVRYNHELIELTPLEDRVVATIVDRNAATRYSVSADYVIGADGGKTVGPLLGAEMVGSTNLADTVTVYFKADLSEYWNDDHAMTTWFVNPEGGSWASGVLGQLGPQRFGRHSEEWMFHFTFRPDDPARFDETSLVPRMRELLKIPDLVPQVLGIGHWVVEGVLVNRYRFGRVFLAGDAAHRHPPTTGLGLNSAVQDAHNLAWKLALVLKGAASSTLLDSYESERRPVADRNVKWALLTYQNHQLTDAGIGLVRGNAALSNANFAALFAETDDGRTRRARLADIMSIQRMEWQAHDLEIGFRYEHGALMSDSTAAVPPDPMGGVYLPTTRPGHRLPHAWIESDGRRLSTHDLTKPGCFVLILGAEPDPWRAAASELTQDPLVPLCVVTIGPACEYADPQGDWRRLREVGEAGAILVRPDNHVGWRAKDLPANPLLALRSAYDLIVAREGACPVAS